MAGNTSLSKAKANKDDEFYTQISDIEKEMKYYTDHFSDKHVFCNCDDPESSNFWRYFALNFESLGLKRLTSTHYEESGSSYQMDMFRDVPDNFKDKETFLTLEETGVELPLGYITPLSGSGDFRDDESIEKLIECDVVVTNPPFSLFREYISQLISYDKKFIVIGNQNAITYAEIFPLFKEEQIWLGHKSGDMSFKVPPHYESRKTRFWIDESGQKWRSMGNICWYTNLEHDKRNNELILYKSYSPEHYPEYDNYNAINVDKVVDIPFDFDEAMGVPVTFLDKHNPNQFEILDANQYRKNDNVPVKKHGLIKDNHGSINGKPKYVRILIKRKE